MKYFAQASSLTASLLLCSTGTAQLSNDDCAGAINLVVGAPAVFDTTLATNSPEVWPCGGGMLDIWYTFTAPNDAWYYFTTCGSGYDTTLEVLSGNCGALASVECNDDACGLQSGLSIQASANDTYYVRVGGWSSAISPTGTFGPGILDVQEILPPAGQSCATTLMSSNNFGSGGGALYFDITITGQAITVLGLEANLDAAPGTAVGMEVWMTALGTSSLGNELNLAAWTMVGVDNGSATALGGGAPTHLPLMAPIALQPGLYGVALIGVNTAHRYTNGNGANQSFSDGTVQIDLGRASNAPFTGTLFNPRIWNGSICYGDVNPGGTNFCMSSVNSSGSESIISGTGSNSLAANDMGLSAGPGPPTEPGIFYYGPMALGGIPFGDGFRCVGGAAGTVVRIFPFSVADGSGTMSTSIDNTNPVHSQFVAGATLNFQAWFRDPAAGLSGFNLSDGLSVTLAP